ncbi:hypothetical protein DPMN_021805 [Dreissena polymorpha]|uniref:Uncharacterized protein n=1 Tax=Dreissena polymorpha TaxID=45954 RepID=A0A9D4SBA4_DREPO|nr:hypothetical protein DPMN_021805 [Dreissena polymorpha]
MLLSNNVNLTEEQCCPTFPVHGGDFGVKTHTISGYGPIAAAAKTGRPHAVTHLYTADNNRLSGQLGLDAWGQILGIGGELLGQEFGSKLNESYPKGTSSLTMGLQTSLLRGRYNLIYKGPYHHKFGLANDVPQLQHSHCISTVQSMATAPKYVQSLQYQGHFRNFKSSTKVLS